MVSDIFPPEIIPFIWFTGISITIYVFFRKFSDVIKERIKQKNITTKKEQGNSTEKQVNNIIEGIPSALNHVNRIIDEQKGKGVSDDQLKGLYDRKKILETVTNNSEVITILKPFAIKILSMVGKF